MKRVGRRPTPTNIKLVQGNPGKRKIGAAAGEPIPAIRLPRPPDGLSAAAVKEWRRLGKQLAELGLMSPLDRNAFATYCEAWAQWLDATREIQNKGMLIRAPSGYPMVNPFFTIARQCVKQMDSLLAEFGLTPGARTRLKAAPPKAPSTVGQFGVARAS